MTFFSGWRPSPASYLGTKGETFSALKATQTQVAPLRVDMGGRRVVLQAAIDQQPFFQELSDCEANAAVGALMMLRPGGPMLSRRDVYLKALYRDGAYTADGQLDNRGTTGETIHLVLRDEGVCLESDCEYRGENEDWQERASLHALQAGYRHRIDATYRITTLGQARGEDVRASILAGRPCERGGIISQSYLDYYDNFDDVPRIWNAPSSSVGGHAELYVGFWEYAPQEFAYLKRTSWGVGGGLRDFPGHAWVNLAELNDADEIYSYHAAPVYS